MVGFFSFGARRAAGSATDGHSVMRRKLFTLCSAVSLLLCAAVGLSWVRSYWLCDIITRGGPLGGTIVWTVHGGIHAVREGQRPFGVPTSEEQRRFGVRTVPAEKVGQFEYAVGLRPNRWMPARFGRERAFGRAYLFVPHWVPLGLFAAAPAAWFARRLRRARRSACGLCIACGYDLRATRHRCPECGNAAA